MTKQGNFTQRTPQAKKQSDQASKQVSKQASGSTKLWPHGSGLQRREHPGDNPATAQSQARKIYSVLLSPPLLKRRQGRIKPSRHPHPFETRAPNSGALKKSKQKRSQARASGRLNFGPEERNISTRHRKEGAERITVRPPGVHDRLGSRDVHSRLGQRRSSSESPPSSDSEDSRRKRRRRVSVSSEDTSDNEDAETGHWKSKNRYREDEDMSLPWRRQKVDAFTRRISDFSEDKRRRMPANVKTYDGTGDPDDHLKIFESAATIENWPQPVWCHMFNSTLVGNARNWFSKLPRRSIDGFEELRRAFRLNFTQRKKCAKNPVELARVKQRQGESTSVYVERYKDECIHVKACPEILKISGFMNGINNPELIKKLNDRVPQTFDELMKRTRSFIQGEAAAADSRKGYSNNRAQEQSRRQSNDQSSSRNNSYRGQRGGRGNDKYTPLTMTPKEILATEGSNFPKPPPMRTPEEQRVGNGYCEYHRQKGHTTNECVQLRQLIDKLVKEGRLDHLVKNIKEGKDKQRGGGKKDAPRDKADTIYMVQSWQRKTKQKVSQKFSQGSTISFPTLTTDNVVVEPLTIEINAAGHDIHRMYIDGGASADIRTNMLPKTAPCEVKSHYSLAIRMHSTTAWMNFGDQITIAIQWHYRKTRDLSDTRGPIHGPWDAKIPRRTANTCHQSTTPPQTPKQNATLVTGDVTKVICEKSNYHDWLSNPVIGPKRACMVAGGYVRWTSTDLNKRMSTRHAITTPDRLESGYPMRLPLQEHGDISRRVKTKQKAVIQLPSPVHDERSPGRLNGCAKKEDFVDYGEQRRSLSRKLKQHIAALPVLGRPTPTGEELELMYYLDAWRISLCTKVGTPYKHRYFQAHPVAVITDQPIKQVISKPDASGRLQKWSVLLGEHNISYRPRPDTRQSWRIFSSKNLETDIVLLPERRSNSQNPLDLFTDGIGQAWTAHENNEAEYEALLAEISIAARMGVRNLEANVDSRLVANHVLGEYVAKEDNMVQYLDKTKSLIQGFDRFTIRQSS
ncbi:reverse transcriptase domain-containing protein [Tanacetum coccineum]